MLVALFSFVFFCFLILENLKKKPTLAHFVDAIVSIILNIYEPPGHVRNH